MKSLWDDIARDGAASGGFHDPVRSVAIGELSAGSTFGDKLESYRDCSVLVATEEQLPTALALIELDGVARRIVLATPDLTPELLTHIAAVSEADVILQDDAVTSYTTPMTRERRASVATEWVLLTSGTTGMPKLVSHSLDSLAGGLPHRSPDAEHRVWSTFYDIRRYGGLQIYLRAVLTGTSLVLSSRQESLQDFLARAALHGVTHISGTPSHWRRVLMSGEAGRMAPRYVRLSGEIADQALLDTLRTTYPNAQIAHAFASTEGGVAFDVTDGCAGFPAHMVGAEGDIDLKVEDGTLRVRSRRVASGYVGASQQIAGVDGYVDTGDLLELIDGRYYFRGRKGGIINVGGLKVYPEEVEAVLNENPRVRMSLVRARRSPITGALVVADVVAADPTVAGSPTKAAQLKSELLGACRAALSAHKVPANLRFVPQLEMTAAGKLVRPGA